VARGDLGRSYLSGEKVITLIRERLPATLLLTGAAAI
jgi:ABC-type dipeptide/oligopeptide/nickel transport system permease component